MVGSGDYNISCAAVFDHGGIVDTTKAWKIEKNSVFAGVALYIFLSIVFASTVFTRTPGKECMNYFRFGRGEG